VAEPALQQITVSLLEHALFHEDDLQLITVEQNMAGGRDITLRALVAASVPLAFSDQAMRFALIRDDPAARADVDDVVRSGPATVAYRVKLFQAIGKAAVGVPKLATSTG